MWFRKRLANKWQQIIVGNNGVCKLWINYLDSDMYDNYMYLYMVQRQAVFPPHHYDAAVSMVPWLERAARKCLIPWEGKFFLSQSHSQTNSKKSSVHIIVYISFAFDDKCLFENKNLTVFQRTEILWLHCYLWTQACLGSLQPSSVQSWSLKNWWHRVSQYVHSVFSIY